MERRRELGDQSRSPSGPSSCPSPGLRRRLRAVRLLAARNRERRGSLRSDGPAAACGGGSRRAPLWWIDILLRRRRLGGCPGAGGGGSASGGRGPRILVSCLSSGISRACEFGSCRLPESAGTTYRITRNGAPSATRRSKSDARVAREGDLIGSRSGEALSQAFPVTIALAPASRKDLDLIPVSD
jgi:hypothetical protein